MTRGLIALLCAYVLSQFYRAFLPVLAPVLAIDLGASADILARASAVWFLVFAAMQIPVGAALDRFGPRWTASILFTVGGAGGAMVFALAQAPAHIIWAMALLGVGCSPVLMAAYFIIARGFSPAVFATLAGALIGFGSFGNMAGSAPMAWAVDAVGWRTSMAGLGGLSLVVGVVLFAVVRDPARIVSVQKGSVWSLLRTPALWPIFAIMLVSYAPAASLRGLWAGPYAADVFGADVVTIGHVTLVMALAMVAGSFAFGPLERLFRTRKWVVVAGNVAGVAALVALWAVPGQSLVFATAMLAIVGISGSTFPVIVAHAKAIFPDHLTGRGVTLMNLFGIGGVGIMQFATGPIHTASQTSTPSDAYAVLFGVFAVTVALGLIAYLWSTDRTD